METITKQQAKEFLRQLTKKIKRVEKGKLSWRFYHQGETSLTYTGIINGREVWRVVLALNDKGKVTTISEWYVEPPQGSYSPPKVAKVTGKDKSWKPVRYSHAGV